MDDKYPNIIVIVIDALRARNLHCYGYPNQISPNIDRIAKDGILFENSYSCATCTDPSLTTIFSGMYPTSHGILSHGGLWGGKKVHVVDLKKLKDSGILFLPEILQAKGYATLAVDWLGRWHRRGYDHYSGMLSKSKPISFPSKKIDNLLYIISRKYSSLQKSSFIDDATSVTEYARWLIRKYYHRRFFLFVHYWDVHYPYAPPPKYVNKINQNISVRRIYAFLESLINTDNCKNVIKENISRYLASIAYVDYEIGRLIKTLKKYGIYDNTMLILTSDHGENLGEHNIFFGHHCLYDEIIHVPLIFKYNIFQGNRRLKGFVQHYDIVPTILDILNIDKEKLDGKTILPMINGIGDEIHKYVYAEDAMAQRKRCIRTWRYKYIIASSKEDAFCKACKCIHGGIEELYDLKNDPFENYNIINNHIDIKNKLRKILINKFI